MAGIFAKFSFDLLNIETIINIIIKKLWKAIIPLIIDEWLKKYLLHEGIGEKEGMFRVPNENAELMGRTTVAVTKQTNQFLGNVEN